MTTGALVMMILAEGIITVITVYFFWKVIKTPPRKEPDSFVENDEEPR